MPRYHHIAIISEYVGIGSKNSIFKDTAMILAKFGDEHLRILPYSC